jgi:hypothetical protein
MNWIERLERWQKLCATLSVLGLLVTGVIVLIAMPQANQKLAKQLAAAECQSVRALPANETNPHALSKEHYALYMQCGELFWYRARHPEADFTLDEYQDRLRNERQGLLLRALFYWLGGVAVIFLTAFVVVRTFRWARPGSNTHPNTQ